MKKLIFSFLSVLSLIFVYSFTLGASLSISPGGWTLGSNCIESFDITLDMFANEQIVASDIVIDSNMLFVDFINWDVFEYSAPAKQKRWLIKLLLFSSQWNKIVDWGKVWKLYMSVPSNVTEPYIDFVFNSVGDTTDTNLSIDWADILSSVRWWNYTIDSNKVCVYNADEIVWWEVESLDMFLDKFESDHKWERVKILIGDNLIVVGVIVIILVIIIVFFFRKKKNK